MTQEENKRSKLNFLPGHEALQESKHLPERKIENPTLTLGVHQVHLTLLTSFQKIPKIEFYIVKWFFVRKNVDSLHTMKSMDSLTIFNIFVAFRAFMDMRNPEKEK